MAEQPKVNPIFVNEARHFNGKSVTAVTVDAGAAVLDAATNYGPGGNVDLLIKAITQAATPIIMSAISADQTFDVYFEGDFESTSEFGSTGALDFAAYLTEEVNAVLPGASVAFMTPPRYGLVGDKF